MDSNDREELERTLREAATEAGCRLRLHVEAEAHAPRSTSGDACLRYLEVGGYSVYLITPRGAEPPSLDGWLEAVSKAGAGARLLTARIETPLVEEYLAARLGEEALWFSFDLGAPEGASTASPARGEARSGALVAVTGSERPRKRTTRNPADLLAGRAILDEACLERADGRGWLLLRCERLGLGSSVETEKLCGELPREGSLYEQGRKRLLSDGELKRIAGEGQ